MSVGNILIYVRRLYDDDDWLPDVQTAEQSDDNDNTTLHVILQRLSQQINKNKVCRFNIYRGDIWEGVSRSIRRTTYTPSNAIFAKFSDGGGGSEGAVDQGGPHVRCSDWP